MTGKQLRNSILQWAIQGKLVPQDPNDEPASVLLERIRAEKARLVKEKKIKKDKNESVIFRGEDNSYYEKMADGTVHCIDSEIPFEIPGSWEWARMGAACDLVTDFVASGSFASLRENVKYYPNKGYALLVRTKDFATNFSRELMFTDQHGYEFLSNSNLFGGELILPNIGASIGKVFIVPKLDIPMTLAPNSIMVRTNNEALKMWFYYVFSSPFGNALLTSINTSTAQGKFSKTEFKTLLVPIPPKEEQVRISSKLSFLSTELTNYDVLFAKIQRLNSGIIEALRKSILQEAIQGRLVPPKESEGTAEELLEEIRAEKLRLVKEGKLRKSVIANDSRIFRDEDNRYYEQIGETITEIEVPFELPRNWVFTRLGNICQLTDGDKREGIEICLDAKYLRGKGICHISKGRYIEKGERLILVDGENSGEVFTAPIAGYMGSTFKRLWLTSCMNSEFILLCLRLYKDVLRNSKKGAAIPHLNRELFFGLIVAIPPLKEQCRIVHKANLLFDAIK